MQTGDNLTSDDLVFLLDLAGAPGFLGGARETHCLRQLMFPCAKAAQLLGRVCSCACVQVHSVNAGCVVTVSLFSDLHCTSHYCFSRQAGGVFVCDWQGEEWLLHNKSMRLCTTEQQKVFVFLQPLCWSEIRGVCTFMSDVVVHFP